MRKKSIFITALIIISLFISTSNVYASEPVNPVNNVYASQPINPIDNIYKEGIYQLNKQDTASYSLQFQFLNSTKNSTIIILDENADIVYKNINCNRKCNAGTITNKNTIVIITDGEVALTFQKIS